MSSARPRFRSLRRSFHLRAIRIWLPQWRRRFFFLFVSEMTENHALVIPIMICAILANAASKLIYPHGVYHTLARRYMAAPHGTLASSPLAAKISGPAAPR